MAHKKSILIIDDEPDIRETIREALSLNGFEATVAGGALQALQMLSTTTNKPGVILLDLMMPEHDGRDFLQDWQKSPGYEPIPIVLISADCHLELASDVYKVNGFLKKPIDLSRLLQVANNYCGQESMSS